MRQKVSLACTSSNSASPAKRLQSSNRSYCQGKVQQLFQCKVTWQAKIIIKIETHLRATVRKGNSCRISKMRSKRGTLLRGKTAKIRCPCPKSSEPKPQQYSMDLSINCLSRRANLVQIQQQTRPASAHLAKNL